MSGDWDTDRPPVWVRHFVACLNCRVERSEGPVSEYHLSGTHYWMTAGSLPGTLAALYLFTRFQVGSVSGPVEFEVRVCWLDAPGHRRLVRLPYRKIVHFRADEPVRDYAIKLTDVPIPGAGRYRLRLFGRWVTEAWRGPEWYRLKTEYIHLGERS